MGNRFCGVSFSGDMISLFWSRYSISAESESGEGQGTDRGMHSQYPLASVTGTDISPIQPSWYVNRPDSQSEAARVFESVTHYAGPRVT